MPAAHVVVAAAVVSIATVQLEVSVCGIHVYKYSMPDFRSVYVCTTVLGSMQADAFCSCSILSMSV